MAVVKRVPSSSKSKNGDCSIGKSRSSEGIGRIIGSEKTGSSSSSSSSGSSSSESSTETIGIESTYHLVIEALVVAKKALRLVAINVKMNLLMVVAKARERTPLLRGIATLVATSTTIATTTTFSFARGLLGLCRGPLVWGLVRANRYRSMLVSGHAVLALPCPCFSSNCSQ